jgi:hypothetical protein
MTNINNNKRRIIASFNLRKNPLYAFKSQKYAQWTEVCEWRHGTNMAVKRSVCATGWINTVPPEVWLS